MKGMKDDASSTTAIPVRGEIVAPTSRATAADGDLSAQLREEARVAEARAAELRARAEQTRAADGSR
jgi:sec-independent protein translocase protein TatA